MMVWRQPGDSQKMSGGSQRTAKRWLGGSQRTTMRQPKNDQETAKRWLGGSQRTTMRQPKNDQEAAKERPGGSQRTTRRQPKNDHETAKERPGDRYSTSGSRQGRGMKSSVHFSQFKVVFMCSGKPIIMRSIPPLRNFPNVTFETVSLFVWLTMAFTLFTKKEIQLGYKQKHMQSVY